ncbi:TPA: hypothetical protein I9065_003002 [Clostridium perfringens]|nr:hypothetical protein [Clostridium perfringens]
MYYEYFVLVLRILGVIFLVAMDSLEVLVRVKIEENCIDCRILNLINLWFKGV